MDLGSECSGIVEKRRRGSEFVSRRLTVAKRRAFSQVVPDFGKVARTICWEYDAASGYYYNLFYSSDLGKWVTEEEAFITSKVSRPDTGSSSASKGEFVPLTRYCEYALLILEYWANALDIQRSAELYEDLLKCCVANAMGEIIDDEDRGLHKRYASPSLRERGAQLSRAPSHVPTSNIPGYGTSTIIAMDMSSTVASGPSLSSDYDF
ncbi:uncharacterized protein A4U43_C03F1470 [Asparagus officinalis]|uniref:Uncharacterized protein n=1 Tax=Asparagus officinalis TaxID=4686 RepID=A0A5P1FBG1_ASPOF|nr:uncharacterized protein A4U43_C03F1470 [Asparagus officinalis]